MLYSFTGSLMGGSDGAIAEASLIDVNGKLYGTTRAGGINGYDGGCGTIFEISTTGKERVLYRFKYGSDGAEP